MATIESNGIHLNYEDTGEGRPVVLIHGWPLSLQSWGEQVPALVDAGYRVITYDRRGFGASDKPESGYDYDTLAADLAGLLDGLDVQDATLVGFSMGGGEVARYLSAHGDDGRVRSGVFAGAVPPYLLKGDDNPDGGMAEEDVQGMEKGVTDDRDGYLHGFMAAFYSAGDELMVSRERVEASYDLSVPARDEAVLGCVGAIGRTDFRNDLEAISQPCLVIHGDSDAILPFAVSGKRTADSLEQSTLVVVEKGPHGFNVSHRDEFNSALLTFLNA